MRTRWAPAILTVFTCFSLGKAIAEDIAVPAGVQANLVSKVPGYDRAFRERAAGHVHALVLTKPGNANAERVANYFNAALAREQTIAGLPHDVALFKFTNASGVVAECKRRQVTVLYVPPGFEAELGAICSGLAPLGVMTFTGVRDFVHECVVVGFDVRSGKPKLLINLAQAKKSNIDFSSEFLRLAEVVR